MCVTFEFDFIASDKMRSSLLMNEYKLFLKKLEIVLEYYEKTTFLFQKYSYL